MDPSSTEIKQFHVLIFVIIFSFFRVLNPRRLNHGGKALLKSGARLPIFFEEMLLIILSLINIVIRIYLAQLEIQLALPGKNGGFRKLTLRLFDLVKHIRGL